MYIRMHEGLGQVPTPLIRCGVDMDDVDVKLRIFIPSPAGKLAIPGWYDITGGDNRGYTTPSTGCAQPFITKQPEHEYVYQSI